MGNAIVAVIFGGRSAEHEVSILTAHEAMAVLREMDGYDVVPVYVTKSGRWLTGEALNVLDKFADPETLEADCRPISLRPMEREVFTSEKTGLFAKAETIAVDVALPLIHGPNGEDGTLQGALDMLGIPYAMSGVLASALCMNKVATKQMLIAAGLAQVPYVVATRAGWSADPGRELAKVDALAEGALFVKPVRGGSSIGITFVEDREALATAIELALRFDEEAVIETAIMGAAEVNCSVLKYGDTVEASVLELVDASGGFLTYEQKYLAWSTGGGAKGAPVKGAPVKGAPAEGVQGHRIPAPISDELTARIQADAKRAFTACTCDGLVRVDFLVKDDEVTVNEINTVPGSLAFYLWEASGVAFPELLDRLLGSALKHAAARMSLTFSLDRNLLADIEAAKGTKRV
ncbi:MAG: D-alanine--D-alanine ligase [Coriobacteriia bacterium]|nr:D-alanine--D-alanine ligase [Coriobacteriia bacterium]